MSFPDIDSTLVTVGAPVEGGCCWTNFSDSPTFPTSATTTLGTGWESLGDLSENGYTEQKQATAQDFKGWHGSVVLSVLDEEKYLYKLEFIEVNRGAVAKVRHGVGNVQVDSDGNPIQISGKPGQNKPIPLVVDELESNGWLRRTVIKKAMINSFDDVPHQKGSLMVYGMTFTAIEVDGSAFETYRAQPASA
ncbi:MAG: hypothetical protein IJ125_05010 [Atopobiaceae bacterium]|nr:hypothetical protein [Atopobiaceae bacterium]